MSHKKIVRPNLNPPETGPKEQQSTDRFVPSTQSTVSMIYDQIIGIINKIVREGKLIIPKERKITIFIFQFGTKTRGC